MDARANFAFGVLTSGIASGATSLSVGAGEGARFPAVPFNAVIWNKTDYPDPAHAYRAGDGEIVRVTNIATDTFTITRAQEGTADVNLNTGGKTYEIWAGPTALYWTQLYANGDIMTTRGDLVRRGASIPERFALGALGTRLLSDGTDVAWFEEQNFFVSFDDFLNSGSTSTVGDTSWLSGTSGGAVSAGSSEADSPGIQVLSTSTSATGLAQIFKNATGILFGGGDYVFETRIKLSDLSDGVETYGIKIGWLDGFVATDGVYFYYSSTINSGQWRLSATSNSATTSTDSSTAATTNWVRLKIVVNAAGTSAEFFVDGVSIGTVASNIPTGAGRQCGPRIVILKSAGTTARTASVDYTKHTFKPTSSR